MSSLFRTKSVEQSIAETEEPEHRLKKNLGALDLTVFGVGVIIGAGIFVYTGMVAATNAGPGDRDLLRHRRRGLRPRGALLRRVRLHRPGGGQRLHLQLRHLRRAASPGSSAGTWSWSSPSAPRRWPSASPATSRTSCRTRRSRSRRRSARRPTASSTCPRSLIALLVAGVLIGGIKLSSRVNQVVVAIKLAVVALVIVVGIFYIKAANYTPFIPPSQPSRRPSGGFWKTPLIASIFGLEPAVFGVAGVDRRRPRSCSSPSSASTSWPPPRRRPRNPQRNVPRSASSARWRSHRALHRRVPGRSPACRTTATSTPTDRRPLATAFDAVGVEWIGNIIAVGATVGLTVVVLILMLGQTRVAFAMARDGLLPPVLAKVHPTFGTPYVITAITGVGVALLAGFVDFATLGDLVSIGTLFAFMLVSVGVLVLRRTRPDLPRAFRTPAVYVVATLSVLLCGYLMLNLIGETWVRFLIWMAIGLVVYFAYGRSHSRLGARRAGGARAPA